MNKKRYIVTSGWTHLSKDWGITFELSDAKIFETEDKAKNYLFKSSLDLKQWTVREVKIETIMTVLP